MSSASQRVAAAFLRRVSYTNFNTLSPDSKAAVLGA